MISPESIIYYESIDGDKKILEICKKTANSYDVLNVVIHRFVQEQIYSDGYTPSYIEYIQFKNNCNIIHNPIDFVELYYKNFKDKPENYNVISLLLLTSKKLTLRDVFIKYNPNDGEELWKISEEAMYYKQQIHRFNKKDLDIENAFLELRKEWNDMILY
jgi:hypothetical protein